MRTPVDHERIVHMNQSPTDDLRATLDRLHQELESLEGGDPAVRQMLVETLHEVEQALEKFPTAGATGGAATSTDEAASEETPDGQADQQQAAEEHSIIDRLREAAQHFEESHPVLSSMIGSTIDALARMGI